MTSTRGISFASRLQELVGHLHSSKLVHALLRVRGASIQVRVALFRSRAIRTLQFVCRCRQLLQLQALKVAPGRWARTCRGGLVGALALTPVSVTAAATEV